MPMLLRLGAPNVLIMLAQASVGLIETFFVGKLGTDALAGMALVVPVVMLMQTISAGAFGGAITSSIARALGGNRRADADALVLHSLAIALALGLIFMGTELGGGRWLYIVMGGNGRALTAAMTYSSLVFSGAVLIWVFNSLSAVIRGTGNMALPAFVTCAGTVVLIPLSPLLIFGWGPVPALGIAGGAVALLAYYLAGSVAFAAYLWSRHSLLRPSVASVRFRWPLFREILRLGLVGTISAAATNVTIGIATALMGGFGTAAIAGYGTAARLEYLLIPLVFGLGSPLVAIVGTCMGADLPERALRTTWIGAAIAFAVTEAIGLLAAAVPSAWLTLFNADPAMVEAFRCVYAVVSCDSCLPIGCTEPRRRRRSPTMWSASTGALASTSRSIEAVRGEPAAVNAALACSRNAACGARPASSAMARHSSRRERIISWPPGDATISPMGARIRQVAPASVARKTHFSHISCTIWSLTLASKPALSRVPATSRMRSEITPSRSPKVSL